jgi:hypothetical protein
MFAAGGALGPGTFGRQAGMQALSGMFGGGGQKPQQGQSPMIQPANMMYQNPDYSALMAMYNQPRRQY